MVWRATLFKAFQKWRAVQSAPVLVVWGSCVLDFMINFIFLSRKHIESVSINNNCIGQNLSQFWKEVSELTESRIWRPIRDIWSGQVFNFLLLLLFFLLISSSTPLLLAPLERADECLRASTHIQNKLRWGLMASHTKHQTHFGCEEEPEQQPCAWKGCVQVKRWGLSLPTCCLWDHVSPELQKQARTFWSVFQERRKKGGKKEMKGWESKYGLKCCEEERKKIYFCNSNSF